MTPCFAVDRIVTPKKFLLQGLWFGPKKPKRAIIFIHGLGGSMWSRSKIVQGLADKKTAVLAFNNRGHDLVANVPHESGKRIRTGAAHEVFTDCVDDIQGAVNFVRRQGVRQIFLAGHSTGCQKSIYWAAKTGSKGVKGIILLAPISDYAVVLKSDKGGKLAKLTRIAKDLVRAGKKHQLMPDSVLSDGSLNDAQRFLSLNTPESIETIFPYEQPGKQPQLLQKVTKAILVLWAQNDEHSDRPAQDASRWFDTNIKAKHRVVVVPGVKHSFTNAEAIVVKTIREFIDNP